MVESGVPQRISVPQILGGGTLADALLWKRCGGGVVTLASATFFWYLFERAGYMPLSFAASVLCLLVTILFVWARSASLLNRPLPSLPDLEVSEESVVKVFDVIRFWINQVLSLARDIAVGGDFKLLIKAVSGLWVISFLGSLANFLTFVYLGIILSFSVPFFYDRYQDDINDKLNSACAHMKSQYKWFHDNIKRKILVLQNKVKKTD